MIERTDISQVLSQMRAVQAQLQRGASDVAITGRIEPGSLVQPEAKADFGALFSKAIDSVNATQKQASALRTAYETGATGVSLTQVMVAAEKSSVAFSAMTQVRNRLVEAYKEIMSMPV